MGEEGVEIESAGATWSSEGATCIVQLPAHLRNIRFRVPGPKGMVVDQRNAATGVQQLSLAQLRGPDWYRIVDLLLELEGHRKVLRISPQIGLHLITAWIIQTRDAISVGKLPLRTWTHRQVDLRSISKSVILLIVECVR